MAPSARTNACSRSLGHLCGVRVKFRCDEGEALTGAGLVGSLAPPGVRTL